MNLAQIINDPSAVNTLLVVSADDLNRFAQQLIAQTQQLVEAKYDNAFYDVKELTKVLHCSTATVYNYINKGLITPVKIEGRTLFRRSEILQLQSSR